ERRIHPGMKMRSDDAPPRAVNIAQHFIPVSLRDHGIIDNIHRRDSVLIENFLNSAEGSERFDARMTPGPFTPQVELLFRINDDNQPSLIRNRKAAIIGRLWC